MPNVTRIFLMAARKAWHHKVPPGWEEVAWERFDYIECAIYEKPTADLTEEDQTDWVAYNSNPPDGWIEPSPSLVRETQMPNFKKIKDYSKQELDDSVSQAELYLKTKDLEFYKILNGIDAYFERRRRKEALEPKQTGIATGSTKPFFGHQD